MFHNIFEFASAVFDIERSQAYQCRVAEVCSNRLYKHSPDGLGIIPLGLKGARVSGSQVVWGIKVTGIVEGTDIEAASDPLMFPFDAKAFWNACEWVAEALADAKAEWDAQGDDE